MASLKTLFTKQSDKPLQPGKTSSGADSMAPPFASVYDAGFFDFIDETSLRSARGVVPHVVALLRPGSIVDVGCGRGAWMRVFRECGVEKIHGFDGAYVDRTRLMVPEGCFTPMDLEGNFRIPGKYDLAVSLEVAEHLPARQAGHLVAQLVNAAPLVLFSAALPGQGGTHHINEQMPAYWHRLFAAHGYAALDPIRPIIRHDRSIDFWYRQNIVLYASEQAIAASETLTEERSRSGNCDLEWVHVSLTSRPASVRPLFRELVLAVKASVRRRLRSMSRTDE
jgi:hypothetical protein